MKGKRQAKSSILRRMRRFNDLNGSELSRLTGLSAIRIQRIETGTFPIRPHEAEILAQVLGTKVELLMAKAKAVKG